MYAHLHWRSKLNVWCLASLNAWQKCMNQKNTRVYFSERVNFFPTYFTTLLYFFPISCTHFYCSLLNFFPNFNFGWIVSLPKSKEFARMYISLKLKKIITLNVKPINQVFYFSKNFNLWSYTHSPGTRTPVKIPMSWSLPCRHIRRHVEGWLSHRMETVSRQNTLIECLMPQEELVPELVNRQQQPLYTQLCISCYIDQTCVVILFWRQRQYLCMGLQGSILFLPVFAGYKDLLWGNV